MSWRGGAVSSANSMRKWWKRGESLAENAEKLLWENLATLENLRVLFETLSAEAKYAKNICLRIVAEASDGKSNRRKNCINVV